MLSAALLLFANTLLFSLRLSGGGSFPKPLSAAEEREYLQRYAQGDRAARDVLIERNLRLVAHIIKKYYTQSADQEDLISIGTIGLIKGITSFNPDKGARLAPMPPAASKTKSSCTFAVSGSCRGKCPCLNLLRPTKRAMPCN